MTADILGPISRIEPGYAGVLLLWAPFDRRGSAPAKGLPLPPGASDVRRMEFRAGRALAAKAIAMLGGVERRVGRGPDRRPLWPQGFSGSISHSGSLVAVAVAPRGGLSLGVDVERIASGGRLNALRRGALDDVEREALDAALPGRRAAIATAIFSAKETLYKARSYHVDGPFGFDAARAVGHPPDASRPALALTRDLGPGLPRGALQDIRGHALPEAVLTWFVAPEAQLTGCTNPRPAAVPTA